MSSDCHEIDKKVHSQRKLSIHKETLDMINQSPQSLQHQITTTKLKTKENENIQIHNRTTRL